MVCILGDSGFFILQGIVKATVFGVFEDLKFKISEGSYQNWSPESALSWDRQKKIGVH